MIAGIEHIGFMAKSPVSLAEWYVNTLEFREIFRTEGENPAVFVAGAQNGMIEFIPYPDGVDAPEKDRRVHFAIAVDDFERVHNQLIAAGVNFPGPVLDLFHGGKAIFFQDPEGNWLHLVYRPKAPWSL